MKYFCLIFDKREEGVRMWSTSTSWVWVHWDRIHNVCNNKNKTLQRKRNITEIVMYKINKLKYLTSSLSNVKFYEQFPGMWRHFVGIPC